MLRGPEHHDRVPEPACASSGWPKPAATGRSGQGSEGVAALKVTLVGNSTSPAPPIEGPRFEPARASCWPFPGRSRPAPAAMSRMAGPRGIGLEARLGGRQAGRCRRGLRPFPEPGGSGRGRPRRCVRRLPEGRRVLVDRGWPSASCRGGQPPRRRGPTCVALVHHPFVPGDRARGRGERERSRPASGRPWPKPGRVMVIDTRPASAAALAPWVVPQPGSPVARCPAPTRRLRAGARASGPCRIRSASGTIVLAQGALPCWYEGSGAASWTCAWRWPAPAARARIRWTAAADCGPHRPARGLGGPGPPPGRARARGRWQSATIGADARRLGLGVRGLRHGAGRRAGAPARWWRPRAGRSPTPAGSSRLLVPVGDGEALALALRRLMVEPGLAGRLRARALAARATPARAGPTPRPRWSTAHCCKGDERGLHRRRLARSARTV